MQVSKNLKPDSTLQNWFIRLGLTMLCKDYIGHIFIRRETSKCINFKSFILINCHAIYIYNYENCHAIFVYLYLWVDKLFIQVTCILLTTIWTIHKVFSFKLQHQISKVYSKRIFNRDCTNEWAPAGCSIELENG